MKSLIIKFKTISFCMIFIGCASTNKANLTEIRPDSLSYSELVNAHTIHTQKYAGLSNTIDIHNTFLSADLRTAIIDKKNDLFQWDLQKKLKEQEINRNQLQKESVFFISLYTPEKQHGDLVNKKTLWNIFVDINGKRYEGKVEKVKLPYNEIISLFPHHSRYSNPYWVSFPIPTSEFAGRKFKFTMTGPVDAIAQDFE